MRKTVDIPTPAIVFDTEWDYGGYRNAESKVRGTIKVVWDLKPEHDYSQETEEIVAWTGEWRTVDINSFSDDEERAATEDAASNTSNNKRELNYRIENVGRQRDSVLAQLDSAIRLLELATDQEVKVPVSQYERLLSASPDSINYRW